MVDELKRIKEEMREQDENAFNLLGKVKDEHQYLAALPKIARQEGCRNKTVSSYAESFNAMMENERHLHPIALAFGLVKLFERSIKKTAN